MCYSYELTVDWNQKDYKCIIYDYKSQKHDVCITLIGCINSSISNGQFPTELKMADVKPISKKG